MEQRFTGKVVLVSGAASGIGEAMSKRFCAEGATVVAFDRSGEEKRLAGELGAACIPVNGDVSSSADVQRVMTLIRDRFGRLDVVCNNAGIQGPLVPLPDYSEEDFDRVIAVDLKGAFLIMKHAIPLIAQSGGGSIINTSSIAALVALPGSAAYSASKAGVAALTKLAAAECVGEGIRVNAILPGVVDSGMTRGELTPEQREHVMAKTLMGRIGEADEIAKVAAFLASNDSSFMTGSLTVIDGGYTLP